MAIPRLEEKYTENHPEEWESPRFLVVIVTWFHSTVGLPLKPARWFAIITCIHTTINEKWWKGGGITTPACALVRNDR